MDRQQKLPQPWTFVGRSAASHVAHLCGAHGMLTCRLAWQLQLYLLLRRGQQALLLLWQLLLCLWHRTSHSLQESNASISLRTLPAVLQQPDRECPAWR